MNYTSYWDILPDELKRKIKEYRIHYISKILEDGINWIQTSIYEEETIMQGRGGGRLSQFIGIPYSLNFKWFVADFVYNSIDSDSGIEISDDIGYAFRKYIFKRFNLLRILYRNHYTCFHEWGGARRL
tara:strand:- start:18 stop:401 length:384 start_codon:yes stop_codon:yes gene_type:complete